MDMQNIYELMDRFDASRAAEMEIKLEGAYLKLKKAQDFARVTPADAAALLPADALQSRTAQAAQCVQPAQAAQYVQPAQAAQYVQPAQAAQCVQPAQAAQYVQPAQSAQYAQPAEEAAGKFLRAPLAGTFYRAASPEAEPYVSKGQAVKKGDVIGLIEAMKMMTEITAEEDGVIEEILAENEALVAYDEVLIRYA